jgi:UDP-galactose transporter B1
MAYATTLVASFGVFFSSSNPKVNVLAFIKPAVTCAIASPLGYAALKYISFPLVILTKSSKPVPVMIIGVIFFGNKYPWYKYVSVLMLCAGIAMFSSAGKRKPDSQSLDMGRQIFGIFLVGCNLFLDGYTNNQQDFIFKRDKVTSFQMMKYVNLWQSVLLSLYLIIFWFIFGENSELSQAYAIISQCEELRYDIFIFCLCASVGQFLVFSVMKEFGSLVWVTVSITRKLVTILISVFAFNHAISSTQWFGVVLVFAGMCLEVYMSNGEKKVKPPTTSENKEKKQ